MTEKEFLGLIKEQKGMIDSLSTRLAEIERVIGVCAGEINGHVVVAMHEPEFDNAHHCGQDAEEEAGVSLKELLGMEVVGVGKGKCEGCPMEHYQADCCKVELVGGDYLCLTNPQPEEEDTDNVMDGIKEKVEEFMDYLDSVIG